MAAWENAPVVDDMASSGWQSAPIVEEEQKKDLRHPWEIAVGEPSRTEPTFAERWSQAINQAAQKAKTDFTPPAKPPGFFEELAMPLRQAGDIANVPMQLSGIAPLMHEGAGAVAGGMNWLAAQPRRLAGQPAELTNPQARMTAGDVETSLLALGPEAGTLGAVATVPKLAAALKPRTLTAAEAEITNRLTEASKVGAPGSTAQQMLGEYYKAPEKPLSLADIGPEGIQALAGRVARTPGPGREIARQFLEERDAAAGTRITQNVDVALGAKSVLQAGDEIKARQIAQALPLKEEAFRANQKIESLEIDRLLKTPDMQKAFRMAVEDMRNQQKLVSVSDKELTELAREQDIVTGHGVGRGLKLEVLDYTKRALDRLIKGYKRAPETGDYATAVDLRRQFVRAMDQADVTASAGPNSLKPEGGAYARYRRIWADGAQQQDAMDWGRDIVATGPGSRNAKTPEQLSREFAELSPAEQEYARLGVASELRKRILATPDRASEARAVAKNDWVRRQLRPLFPDETTANRFFDQLAAEATMFERKQKFIGNSLTEERAVEDTHMMGDAGYYGIHAMQNFARGDYSWGFINVLRALSRIKGKVNPETEAEIAKILFSPLSQRPKPSAGMKFLMDYGMRFPNTRNMLKPTQQWEAADQIRNYLRQTPNMPP